MTVAPVLNRGLHFPSIARQYIQWQTLDIGIVEISIELVNSTDEPTSDGMLMIEAAPLGAFVPHRPLTRVAVGSLEPGERRSMSVFVSRDALNGASPAMPPIDRTSLPKSIGAILDATKSMHWIGNLNVYFDRDPKDSVERHCAFNLKVPAGNQVAAMFMLMEDCTLETKCSSPDWAARAEKVIGHSALLVVDTPSTKGKTSEVRVDAVRIRDGVTVPVEFEFETVEGWGEAVGCVRV
jgi:hypothetical protein